MLPRKMPFTRNQVEAYVKEHIAEHAITCPGCRKAETLAVVTVVISPVLTAASALEVFAKPNSPVLPELVLRCQACAASLHLEWLSLSALWRKKHGDPDPESPAATSPLVLG